MISDDAASAGKYSVRMDGLTSHTADPAAIWRKILNFRMFCRNRKVYGELLDLPDHLLDDIGLSRSDVMAARFEKSPVRPKRR
ncbi:DUF1127 domain-containing protein [uncultured Roseibium sp.]|uniref:DUF1127 domain-containing protein n=1 Tax=uncultured Roseibium sp. TaxID=1936171 RepID=UPI002624D2C2|nr:DUF1127 domain-containing protein [uncultured Roseibium sp.]